MKIKLEKFDPSLVTEVFEAIVKIDRELIIGVFAFHDFHKKFVFWPNTGFGDDVPYHHSLEYIESYVRIDNDE